MVNIDKEKSEKFKKRVRKLSNILDSMCPNDIEELRKEDSDLDVWLRNITDFVGSSNPYWRIHPQYPFIRCSINGEFDISGQEFTVREFDGILKVCYSHGTKKMSAPDLVMACFNPCPGNRSEYRICYKDKDYRNLKPSNLYWKRIIVR